MNEKWRDWQSRTLLLLQIAIAVLYLFPSIASPPQPQTTAVVAALSHLGPVWTVLFAASAIGLTLGHFLRRYLHYAHFFAASIWVIFGTALWWGAVVTGGTVLTPCLASVLVVIHSLLGFAYGDADELERRANGPH